LATCGGTRGEQRRGAAGHGPPHHAFVLLCGLNRAAAPSEIASEKAGMQGAASSLPQREVPRLLSFSCRVVGKKGSCNRPEGLKKSVLLAAQKVI